MRVGMFYITQFANMQVIFLIMGGCINNPEAKVLQTLNFYSLYPAGGLQAQQCIGKQDGLFQVKFWVINSGEPWERVAEKDERKLFQVLLNFNFYKRSYFKIKI